MNHTMEQFIQEIMLLRHTLLKARMQLMRDFGAYPSGNSGFLLNLGLETLAIRMEKYCSNALKVAEYF